MRKLDDIYVTVKVEQPCCPASDRELKLHRMADQAEKDIRRHLDVELGDRVYNYVCSSCGARWTEKSEKYNGGCCSDDEINNPESAVSQMRNEAE